MATYYVSPTGLATNSGTSSATPWDFNTSITTSAIVAGDVVNIAPGSYETTATWVSTVSVAVAGSPVTWQNSGVWPQRALVSGTGLNTDTFRIDGNNQRWVGVEFQRNQTTSRATVTSPGAPAWLNTNVQKLKMIHCVFHDGANGFFCDNNPGDIELYGCYSYNNGIDDNSSRVHGYYLRHAGTSASSGSLQINECVAGQQLGNGIQIYGSVASVIDDIYLVGNICFNASTLGSMSTSSNFQNIVVAQGISTAPLFNCFIDQNYTYFPPAWGLINFQLGLSSSGASNQGTICTNNVLVGGMAAPTGDGAVQINSFATVAVSSLTFSNNTIYTSTGTTAGNQPLLVVNQSGKLSFSTWTQNTFYTKSASDFDWRIGVSDKTWGAFQSLTSLGFTDTISTTSPGANLVVVRPTAKYGQQRGHVLFYNWLGSAQIPVNLSSILSTNDPFQVWNVQRVVDNTPIIQDTYAGGTYNFPTTGVTPYAPLGATPNSAPATAPTFDAFLVVKGGPGGGGGAASVPKHWASRHGVTPLVESALTVRTPETVSV